MKLNEMKIEELNKLASFIGNGTRPIKACKAFGLSGKGAIEKTKTIRAYCRNRAVEIDEDLLFETRKMYRMIRIGIYSDFDSEIKEKDFSDFVKGK